MQPNNSLCWLPVLLLDCALLCLQDQPIDVDEESKGPAFSLLDLRKESLSPPAAYQAVSPIVSSLPFLQVGTSSAPVTPRGLVGSPDFSTLRHQLTSLSNTVILSSGVLAASASPIGFAAAMSALRTLVSCEAEEVFGEKAGSLRDALVRMLSADFIPREAKDGLQSFLQRL